ncbi:phosphoribosylglycinamide formyltransferase [Galbibacter sp.]|uniref:phosphoribosylglycinamide formyltransferase n=1 Tax=Galbibacter sp. TaxID=2918471 RepID=UPI003A94AAE9
MKSIIIMASGSGSNAENIVRHFESNKNIQVKAIFSNKKDAMVLDRASKLGISAYYFNKKALLGGQIVELFKALDPDLIVLAGFLWKVPTDLVDAFENKIINIHPALLPKYGGKGMFGMNVHRAVKENNEAESGISIHFVNENYDKGNMIFQAKTAVLDSDSAEQIAEKVHALEYEHFPKVIEKLLNGKI